MSEAAVLSEQDMSDIGDYAYRAWLALDNDAEELAHCIGLILYRLRLEPFATKDDAEAT